MHENSAESHSCLHTVIVRLRNLTTCSALILFTVRVFYPPDLCRSPPTLLVNKTRFWSLEDASNVLFASHQHAYTLLLITRAEVLSVGWSLDPPETLPGPLSTLSGRNQPLAPKAARSRHNLFIRTSRSTEEIRVLDLLCSHASPDPNRLQLGTLEPSSDRLGCCIIGSLWRDFLQLETTLRCS